MSTSYYVVMFHRSVKVVRKISRSGMTSMSRYSRRWLFRLQGHCKKRNTLRGAQNYNTGLEVAPNPDLPPSSTPTLNVFCKTIFVFLLNLMYDLLSSVYSHAVSFVALWESWITSVSM